MIEWKRLDSSGCAKGRLLAYLDEDFIAIGTLAQRTDDRLTLNCYLEFYRALCSLSAPFPLASTFELQRSVSTTIPLPIKCSSRSSRKSATLWSMPMVL